eukprot:TRINITY_DN5698_c0_g1_i1.p1 TRINITY_DN5698_c0_g1~~TRINITY_DN5698_c0_g1_i1.p1  ORF type:complete len:121 (-),score=32.79 TRINITY_DN5698_c0_g1_i1:233-595(-)
MLGTRVLVCSLLLCVVMAAAAEPADLAPEASSLEDTVQMSSKLREEATTAEQGAKAADQKMKAAAEQANNLVETAEKHGSTIQSYGEQASKLASELDGLTQRVVAGISEGDGADGPGAGR